jgi:hypothetical protein
VNSDELFELEQRKKRDLLLLQDSAITQNEYMKSADERHKRIDQEAADARALYEQKRAAAIAAKEAKEKELKRAKFLKTETKSQKNARLHREQQRKLNHENELKSLEKEKVKEIAKIKAFFEQSSGDYHDYSLNQHTVIESPVSIIIASREFATDTYGKQKFAYRCSVCGVKKPESLSLATIEKEIYNNRALHEDSLIEIIEKQYDKQINALKLEWSKEQNQDYRNEKIDKELEQIKRIKPAPPSRR